MAQKTPFTRRDPRFALRAGSGFVDFRSGPPAGRPYRADLVAVSVAGLTLEMDAGPSFEIGAVFPRATIHVGACVVEGELLVKHSETVRETRIELGCLFYPSSELDEEKWSATVEGLQAAKGGP
jgi:hypothetical protein